MLVYPVEVELWKYRAWLSFSCMKHENVAMQTIHKGLKMETRSFNLFQKCHNDIKTRVLVMTMTQNSYLCFFWMSFYEPIAYQLRIELQQVVQFRNVSDKFIVL